MKTEHCDISQDDIARRAYEIWQARGCPATDGSDEWKAAEAELVAARVRRNGSTQQRLRSIWGRVRQTIAGENP
jgi:hypothetical protein